nr:hypothetical protein Iba_chr04fCG6870 [Ipomoea batatas]
MLGTTMVDGNLATKELGPKKERKAMYHSPDIIIRKHGGRFRSTRKNDRGLNWALELGVEVNEVVADERNCTDSGLDGVGMQGQAFRKEPRAGLGEEESACGSVVLLEAVID